MSPFEFVLLFVSFIYALALTHLLMGLARMVRRRRELTFSWPHGLWMTTALLSVMTNWISFWDFHEVKIIDLGAFAGAAVLCVTNYLAAALVTPEFEDAADDDLRAFHVRQGGAYMGAFLVLVAIALLLNMAAGLQGVTRWGEQNWLVLLMAAPVAAALWVKRAVVQVAAPAIEILLFVWFAVTYYPQIA